MFQKSRAKGEAFILMLVAAIIVLQVLTFYLNWPLSFSVVSLFASSISLLSLLVVWRFRKVLSLLKMSIRSEFRPVAPNVWPLNPFVKEWNEYAVRQKSLREEIKLERDLAINKAKGKARFLANMSHEIRTPLNGINGTMHLMRNTSLNSEQLGLVEISEHSSNHLLNVVNMILDYSKLDAGGMKLQEEPINLEQEVKYLLEMFRFKAREKSVRLEYDFQKSLSNSAWYFADSMRLQQVLINLLNNALKFTEKGQVSLMVQAEPFQEGGLDKLTFSIQDSGIGIEKADQEKLFTAFEQGDSSKAKKYGGTGLGLAISQSLVQLMGGEIDLVSEKNLGSRFFFSIPLRRAKAPEEEVKVKWEEVDLSEKGLKVLVAEDNKVNQQIVKMMLQRLQVEVTIAQDGQEALRCFEKQDYDLIFMDLQMPILDGYAATRSIHSSPKFHANPVPIIALTASAPADVKSRVLDAGMDDFIMKPFKPKDLETVLERFSRTLT